MTAFALGHPLYPHNSTLVRTNKPRINAGNFSLRYTDNQKSGTGETFHGVRSTQSGSTKRVATVRGPQRPTRSTGPDQAKKEASLRSFVKQVPTRLTSNHPPTSRTYRLGHKRANFAELLRPPSADLNIISTEEQVSPEEKSRCEPTGE